jgi:hypothetical protein
MKCPICKLDIQPGEQEEREFLGEKFFYHKKCYEELRKKIYGRDARKKP